jgi:hypothetical protein
MADETTRIQLELDASVKNLASLETAEKRILALIDAYKKLSDAAAAGAKAAQVRVASERAGGAANAPGGNPEMFRAALGDAKAALGQLEAMSKKMGSGPIADVVRKQIEGVKQSITALSDPMRGAGAIGTVLSKSASDASGNIKALRGELEKLQGTSGEPGKPARVGAIEAKARQVRDLEDKLGKISTPRAQAEAIKQQAIDRGEAPAAALARTAATRAAAAAAESATTEATAKKETAKAAKAVAEETGKAAKNTKVVAEQTTATTKAATKVAAQASPKATPSEISASLGGPLRSLLSQASRDPMGPVNRPTRRELEGASNLPIANRLAGRTLAGGAGGQGGDGGATNALRGLAAAAERASAALSRLSTSTAGSARAAVGGAATPVAAPAAAPKSVIAQLQQEVETNRQAAAALHKTLRQQEALSNPRYKQAVQERAASQVTYAQSVNSVAASSNNAARAIGGMARQQDAIAGQIKNVIGMAAGYQVLQGIAGEVGQIFGHLKGGIIGFNSLLEQATVGFTTLFRNQAQQLFAAGEGLTQQQVLAADVSGKIDYIRMGYSTAEGAAEGMISTIREFANVTPFRFAELQESALRMRAFGFSLDEVLRKNPDTKKFEGGIVAVGNAVSALGGGADAFRRITYALGQMKQAGRVYQNDMMQLANAGIGGYRYIADQLKREITTDGSGSRTAVKKGYESMFNELESNAIEAVRRLTTNGKISGEAASRAILAGLEKDFAGGMEAQARTFTGAFSTVADTSQSLVADAFQPLYNSIRDTTVELGDFLQRGDVRKRAFEFAKTITTLVDALTELGTQVMSIVVKSFGDFSNIISSLNSKTKQTGVVFNQAFGGLATGIKTVLSLLENDMFRALIFAGGLTKMLFAFTASNPMLTQILMVTTAIGLLKQAYDQNFAGVGDAIDGVVVSLEPMITVIRDQIIPLAAQLAGAFGSTVFAAIAKGFAAISPIIQGVVVAVELFLRVVKLLEGPLTAIFILLGASFVFGKLVAGLASVGRQIGLLMIKFDQLAQKARNAGAGMVTLPNSYGKAGVAPLKYDGKAPTAVSNLATAAERAATSLLKVAAAGGAGTTRAGRAAAARAGGAAAVVGGGIAPVPVGASSPLVTGGRVLGSIGTATGGAGMAAMLIGGLMQTGDEATAAIGATVMNVGMGLSAFAAIKSIIPPGMFGHIATGLKMVLENIKAMAAANFPVLAGGLGKVKGGLTAMKTAMLGTAIAPTALGSMMAPITGAFSSMFAGITAGAVAATAGVALLVVGAVLLIKVIGDKIREETAKQNAKNAEANQTAMNDVLGTNDKAPTAEDYLALEAGKSLSEDKTTYAEERQREKDLAAGKSFTVERDKGFLGTGFGAGSEEEKDAKQREQQAAVDRIAAYNKRLAEYRELMSNPMTAKYYKQSRLDHEALMRSTIATSPFAKKNADAMELLVGSQKQATKNQEYLNWLLAKAKGELATAQTLMQTIAEKTLQDMLNPAARTNPYTGLEEAGLTLEEVLATEQDMGFARFENAQGVVRSFDEYRDLLNSILPITDKDLVNGELSLHAVQERLKIDKERKKELEHIKEIAEAEYDFGMAQLSMYDESVDPLQRGVQMRQAQLKYTEDINKLQSEGVEIVLDEAKASKAYVSAGRVTKKRLEDIKAGQQLIIDEMKNMFTQYNTDIANILSNPVLSATQRRNAIEARVAQLNTDLEKNFGITAAMMQTTLTALNAQIDTSMAQLGNPALPNINWGGTLADKMEAGGFGVLTSYLAKKAIEVSNLQSSVFASLDSDAMVKKMAVKNRDALVKVFRARMAAARELYFSTRPYGAKIPQWNEANDRGISQLIDTFSGMTDYQKLLTNSNLIDSRISSATGNRFARGGNMQSGRIGLVGEQGPELFLPRSSGMVLSNSISSRLMGMLGGGGMAMAGANNVTINVNNPVIRSDNDIRKLANEISKAQASQFRVNGGRLS